MLWKKKEEKMLDRVDIQTGIDLLQEQIEAAKQLLVNRPVKSEDRESWNNRTHAVLIRIYGERSPNLDTITRASGEAPVWLFMPDDAAERYETVRLEDKMHKLEQCVVALKRKARETQIS
jgi:hypothetical protein